MNKMRDESFTVRIFMEDPGTELINDPIISFNDVPQSNLVASAVIYKAFEEYASQHDIAIDVEEDDMFSEETEDW